MNDTMKAGETSRIPTPLRDWLDNTILEQMSEAGMPGGDTALRKASIANAILYPLENKPRKTKNRHP